MGKTNIRGRVVMKKLSTVKPNSWNPNAMTDFLKASLKAGFEADGWIASQALLIWGTDDKGKRQNIIIDGEHRWHVANELGMGEVPMVFLDGLTEAQAKALTVKMDAKRGTFDQDRLAELIQSISGDVPNENFALELGIPGEQFMSFFSLDEDIIPAQNEDIAPKPPPGEVAIPSGKSEHVKMQQLFFDEHSFAEFNQLVANYSKKHGSKTVTETIQEAFRVARSAHSAS